MQESYEQKDEEVIQTLIKNLQGPHYSMGKGSEFFNSTGSKLQLSEDSKRLFKQGHPGQGYVGLVDLKTGLIHLLPSFNSNDGLLREDKDGQEFKQNDMVESKGSLGVLGGDLHTQAGNRRIKRPGSTKEKLGFGIWKGGCSVKVRDNLPNISGRIPNEYILIKNPDAAEYQLYYIDKNRVEVALDIEDIEGLRQVSCIAKNFNLDQIAPNDRKLIESLIRKYHHLKHPFEQVRKDRLDLGNSK
jgi:hypothetical protein